MTARAVRNPSSRRFYAAALTEAERAELASALDVEGVDAEIAALRLRLKTHLEDRPEDLALLLRGMDVLRRLVATKYGVSSKEPGLSNTFAEETLRRARERGGDEADDDAE